MDEKKKEFWEKFLGITTFGSLFLPILACIITRHHDCRSDECMRIFYHGRLGDCVESMIDSICAGMAFVGVWYIVIGGAIIWSNRMDSVSPFVAMFLTELFAVFLAFIDPAKWLFAGSLLIPYILVSIAWNLDNKRKKEEKI